MGNCLVVLQQQEKVVRIMKSDGKILEYKTPIKVHQVLCEFSGHAISDSIPLQNHLHPNSKLLMGHLYYLVPLPPPPPPPSHQKLAAKKKKKKVRFADHPEVVEESAEESSAGNKVVRIKVVISKKELHDMLHNNDMGEISVNEVLSLVHHAEKGLTDDHIHEEDITSDQGWKPALESIPEVN